MVESSSDSSKDFIKSEEEIKKSKDLNISLLKKESLDLRSKLDIKIKILPFYKRWWRWLKRQWQYIKHKNNG